MNSIYSHIYYCPSTIYIVIYKLQGWIALNTDIPQDRPCNEELPRMHCVSRDCRLSVLYHTPKQRCLMFNPKLFIALALCRLRLKHDTDQTSKNNLEAAAESSIQRIQCNDSAAASWNTDQSGPQQHWPLPNCVKCPEDDLAYCCPPQSKDWTALKCLISESQARPSTSLGGPRLRLRVKIKGWDRGLWEELGFGFCLSRICWLTWLIGHILAPGPWFYLY